MTDKVVVGGKTYKLRFVSPKQRWNAAFTCGRCSAVHSNRLCEDINKVSDLCCISDGVGGYWKEHVSAPRRARNSQ